MPNAAILSDRWAVLAVLVHGAARVGQRSEISPRSVVMGVFTCAEVWDKRI